MTRQEICYHIFPQIQGVRRTASKQKQGVQHNNLGASDSRTPFSVQPCFYSNFQNPSENSGNCKPGISTKV